MKPLLYILPLIVGCTPKVFPEDNNLPTPTNQSYGGELAVDFSTAWEVAIEVLAEEAPIVESNNSTGEIETGWIMGPSDDVFTAYGGTRIPEPARYRFFARVEPYGQGSFVTVYGQQEIEKDMISIDREFTGAIYQWIEVATPVLRIQNLWERVQESANSRTGTSQEYDYQY